MNIKKFLYDNFIVIFFFVASLLVMGIVVYTSIFIFSLSTYFRDSVDERLRFVSRSAARLVTADELAELNSPEDMDTPLFADIRSRLIAFGDEADVIFVYFLKPLDAVYSQFIADNDLSDDSVNLASEPVKTEPPVFRAYGGETVVTGLEEYSVGYTGLLTAFSPVYDSERNIVAVAGVDISDEQVLSMRRRILILTVIILVSMAMVLLSGVLSFIVNRNKQNGYLLRIKQQGVMSKLSRNFISSKTTPALITDALRITGEFLGVDRILIGVAQHNSEMSNAAYVWSKSSQTFTAPETTGLNDLINNTFPYEQPANIPTVCCNNINDDKRFAVMETVGVRAFVWAPLYVESKCWALLCIEEFTPRVWTDSDRQLVSTVSSVIAGAVERDLREKERDAARQAAENASKAKSDFLANMSHEMRTPMNAIIGMTSIAKNSNDIEKKEYCLGKIENASTHLLGVINDILDMSKIEANKFELSPRDFGFEKMLQKTVNVINFKIDERQQKFSILIDPDIPATLHGDDQRLAQVITNLLSNAVKFTPEGGTIRLDAKLVRKERDICTLEISVTDSGIGISPEQQARLFGSFEQADSSTSRKFGGTGLGLAISKRIVEMMNGSIRVESELGKGASFVFTVQAAEAVGQLEELSGPVDWDSIRVLAVDDDPDIREIFADIAERVGFACDIAMSGEDALAMLEKNKTYDLYFVDWKMPGMDGIELSRKIRAGRAGKGADNSVVIMISAVDWNMVEADAKAAGVNSFLSKPLLPSSVAEAITRCLGVAENVEAGAEVLLERYEGKRVLLAEDIDINREIVMSLLEPTGLAIDCAENGADAVSLFREAPESYDIIFMDVQMPEMDGYEATRQIRAFEVELHDKVAGTRERIPIIAMTANVFKEDIEQCLAAGMDSHVGKPLDFGEVMDKLRQFL